MPTPTPNLGTSKGKEVIDEEEDDQDEEVEEVEIQNEKNSSMKFNASKKGKDLLDVMKLNKMNAK